MRTFTVNAITKKVVEPDNVDVPAIERPAIDTAIDTVLRFKLMVLDNTPWVLPQAVPITAKVWNRKGALALDIMNDAVRVLDHAQGLIFIAFPPGGAVLATTTRAGLTIVAGTTIVLQDTINVRNSAFQEIPKPAPPPWPSNVPTKFMPWKNTKEYIDAGLTGKVTKEELFNAIQAALGSAELQGLGTRPMALGYLPLPDIGWFDTMVLYYGPTVPQSNITNGHLYKCTTAPGDTYTWTDITPESWLVGQWITYED